MSQKFAVVQGAMCSCQHGDFPDILQVLSHQKYYANDPDGADKLLVTSMEIGGATFEKNTFGQCKLQPTGSSFKPCQIVITQWEDVYENTALGNGGTLVLEDSKAICPIAGSACISIMDHGQSQPGSVDSAAAAHPAVQQQLNPLVSMAALEEHPSPVIEEVIVT